MRRSCKPKKPEELVGPKQSYLIPEFLPAGRTTLIFGPRSSGKVWLALAAAHAVVDGVNFLGREATSTGPVLYMDWINSKETIRLRASMIGFRGEIHYVHMAEPLLKQWLSLERAISNHDPALIILASIPMASGLRNQGRFVSAVRSLMRTTLVLGWPAAMSRTLQPLADLTWRVISKPVRGGEQLLGSLNQRRNKLGSLGVPVPFRLTFEPFSLERLPLHRAPVGVPLPRRILALLEEKGPVHSDWIAEFLGEDLPTVQSRLSELKRRGEVERTQDGYRHKMPRVRGGG